DAAHCLPISDMGDYRQARALAATPVPFAPLTVAPAAASAAQALSKRSTLRDPLLEPAEDEARQNSVNFGNPYRKKPRKVRPRPSVTRGATDRGTLARAEAWHARGSSGG
ncbi:MAG: hypothetical protein ACK41Y_16385, partial [Paracoccus hibiscisoli]|uniref:hypothetical protein n=1 Tax=Paracoccus hibiscisoli TaxID=2023261 RepID=UPI00391B5BB2